MRVRDPFRKSPAWSRRSHHRGRYHLAKEVNNMAAKKKAAKKPAAKKAAKKKK
jgi:hypothetical protein